MGILRFASYFIMLYILISFLGSIWLAKKSYQFHIEHIEAVAKKWSGTSFPQTFKRLRDDLESKNSMVLSENDFLPLSLSTGGLQGSIQLLYASLSEFLVVYHAPFQTVGDTGRHFMNMSVTVLQGEVEVWNERSGKKTHITSTNYKHRIGERTIVQMKEDTCLLVYSRGLIPLTMGYWIWDSLFSSLDPASAILTLAYYIRAVYSSMDLGTFFSSWYESTWTLASDGIAGIVPLMESILTWITETAANLFQSGKSIMSDK